MIRFVLREEIRGGNHLHFTLERSCLIKTFNKSWTTREAKFNWFYAIVPQARHNKKLEVRGGAGSVSAKSGHDVREMARALA
jgi:hypothetical protein